MSVPTQFAAALAGRSRPLAVYFRDDDAGWDDAALAHLLDRFARRQAPLDLALIPGALRDPLVAALGHCAKRQRLGLHQHGHVHVNHENTGRKCEFGPARAAASQAADIRAGAQALRDAFGGLLQPIFTPPWNRCTQDTVQALTDAGFQALSRDAGAAPLAMHALRSLPVHLDWQKRARDVGAFAAALAREAAVGVMLHHAAMDARDHDDLDALLTWLRASPGVRWVRMGDLLHDMESELE